MNALTELASPEADLFQLRIGPLGDALRVVTVDGVEALSALFRFDVVCESDVDDTIVQMTLGQSATLRLATPSGVPHVVQGIVAAVRVEGVQNTSGETPKHRYRFRIVPRMWILKRRKNSRIFQDMSMVEIVTAVLRDAQISHDWTLTKEYPKRVYCVQYKETDWAFVTRLLAEEGVFFYFEPPPSTGSSAIDGAIDAVGAAGAAIGSAVSAVAPGVGDALSELTDEITEKVVFIDAAEHYPAIEDGLVGELAEKALGELESAVKGTAIGEALDAVGARIPAPSVPYRAGDGFVQSEEHVQRIAFERRIKSRTIVLRDYDFRRPMLNLTASAGVDSPLSRGSMPASSLLGAATAGPTAILDQAKALATDAVGDALETASFDPRSLEVYEHDGEYEEPEVERELAQRLLEEHRAKARVAIGEATCRRFSAGYRFRLDGHPDADLDREWVVTKVVHRGRIPERVAMNDARATYRNEFHGVPAEVPFRPRPKRREVQQVLESATVVGPAGDEIYTDEYGRIKVQFHWDRDGQDNENSSCWIRTAQPWAGASFGFQFIPRVGSEVLVSFLGGDEDRPIIVGSVYNKTHPAPFPLPFSKTKSGIMTRTTPTTAPGSNELSFEDDRGNEHILLRGERDVTFRAGRDQTTYAARNQETHVTGNQHHNVGGQHSLIVEKTGARSIGETETVNVGHDQRVRIGGVSSTVVGGPASLAVNGQSIVNEANESRTVYGYSSLSVGSDDKPTGLSVSVQGVEAHQVTDAISIRSDKSILLEVGDSSIFITTDTIHVQSKKVVVNGTESTTLFGKGPAIQFTDKTVLTSKVIDVYSKGASLAMDDNVKLMAPTIEMGTDPESPPDIKDDAEKPKTKKIKWKMLDENLAPYKGKTFVLVTQGLKKKDTTDGEGFIQADVPKEAFLAEIDLWTDDFPEGPRRHYSLMLVDPPPSTVPAGAAIRLRHLGYYAGPNPDEITPELETAIRGFQRDQQVQETGELDGATTGKLDEVHPSS